MVVRYALRLTVALTDSHAVAPGLAAVVLAGCVGVSMDQDSLGH